MPVDILALAAHRDDVEQTCGGTLLKMADRGYRTGILDLTQGEMGTRGSAEDRAREAADAARILKVSWRHALDIPDGRVGKYLGESSEVARRASRTEAASADSSLLGGANPDHYTVRCWDMSQAFLAGLAKLVLSSQLSVLSEPSTDSALPHRPFKIIYASLYRDVRPSVFCRHHGSV